MLCKCDCGNIVEISGNNLKRTDNKATKSCGCLKKSNINLVGQKFGELTVLKLSDKDDGHRHKYWECICSCGTIVYVTTHDLTRQDNKARKSCSKKCSMTTNEIGKKYGKLTVIKRSKNDL